MVTTITNYSRKEIEWTTNNLFACELLVADDNASIEATFECWFDVEKKFNVNLDEVAEKANDIAWINLYANFYPHTGALEMHYTVDDNRKNESFDYIPSTNERAVVIASMESACQKENGCSMAELLAQYTTASTSGKNLCAVSFHRAPSNLNVVSVLLEISPESHDDLENNFLLNIEERQDAYKKAAAAIGEAAISECVIGNSVVFRSTQYLLIEGCDSSFYELSFFDTRDAAHVAMRKRVADVRDADLAAITESYLNGEEFDDDTCVLEDNACTKQFGNPYDWSISTISAIPGAKYTDKDPRFLLITMSDRDILEPEIFDTEEDARNKMFERIGDGLCVSIETVRGWYDCCACDESVKLDARSAHLSRSSETAWIIVPMDETA